MSKQGRGEHGRFVAKSDQPREVRSLRLTDTAWEKLGSAANLRCITRSDLIEELIESGVLDKQPTSGGMSLQQVEAAISQILTDPVVTRNGKDRGSVKRALEALLKQLS